MKIGCVVNTALLALAGLLPTAAGSAVAQRARPVLVELFTSEGCSSCPPADALLRRLAGTQPVPGVRVVALEEHVDYWNGLGWRDPFSSAQFTRRQYRYAKSMHGSSAYTPQMVVNGSVGFVGSAPGRARAAIAAAADTRLATISLSRTSVKPDKVGLRVAMQPLPADGADQTAEVWLAVTEDGLADRVTAGENGGRRLLHDAVVRHLERVGQVGLGARNGFQANPAVSLAPDWNRQHLHAVVFVQGATSRHVLGIASLALSPLATSN